MSRPSFEARYRAVGRWDVVRLTYGLDGGVPVTLARPVSEHPSRDEADAEVERREALRAQADAWIRAVSTWGIAATAKVEGLIIGWHDGVDAGIKAERLDPRPDPVRLGLRRIGVAVAVWAGMARIDAGWCKECGGTGWDYCEGGPFEHAPCRGRGWK